MNNPDTWTDTDWARHDAALDRLLRRSADQFARDLDLLGWMIVPQPQHDGTGRWPMSYSGPCPDWAEPFDPPDGPPTKPTLRLIEGGNSAAALLSLTAVAVSSAVQSCSEQCRVHQERLARPQATPLTRSGWAR